MNKDHIKNCIDWVMKLRPPAKVYKRGVGREVDDDWFVVGVNGGNVQIRNVKNEKIATLGFDQVHSFVTDPQRGQRCGIFKLCGVLCLKGEEISFEPTERPGKSTDDKVLPLKDVINYSSIPPAIRSYLIEQNILKTSDVLRINFHDMLKTHNIGKKGVQKLIHELVYNGLWQLDDYTKKIM